MKVIIRQLVEDDLDRIFAPIAQDNPSAAAAMVAKLPDRISFLETDSLAPMGRPGLDPGTCELIEYPYIIFPIMGIDGTVTQRVREFSGGRPKLARVRSFAPMID